MARQLQKQASEVSDSWGEWTADGIVDLEARQLKKKASEVSDSWGAWAADGTSEAASPSGHAEPAKLAASIEMKDEQHQDAQQQTQ